MRIKLAIIIGLLLIPATASAQSVWFPTGSGPTTLTPSSATWGIKVPQLGTAGNPCLTVSVTGVFSTQSCAAGAVTGSGSLNALTYWPTSTTLAATTSNPLYIGSIFGTTTATSTLKGPLSFVYASSTATSTFAGINLPYGGCVAVNGTCLTSNVGTVTSVGLSTPNSSLSIGSSPITTSGTITADFNLNHRNDWIAIQTFVSASSTSFSSLDGLFVGRTASTTIVGENGTSTFSKFISFTAASSTATSTLAGVNLPSGGCYAVNGVCIVSNTGTVTSVATNNGITGGTITTTGTIGLDLSAVGNAFSLPLTLNGSNQLVATGTKSLAAPFFIATSTASSTFQGALGLTYASTTATSTMSGINLPYGGCVAINGTCLTNNTGTVTSVATNAGLTGGTITTSGTLGLDTSTIYNGLILQYNGTRLTATGTPALTVGYLIGTSTASSSLQGPVSFTYASSTATSTMAGINLPYGGCVAVAGVCLTTNAGTVTSVGLSSTNSTLTIGSTPITTSGTITADLNLATANIWTGLQQFKSASSTSFSVYNGLFVGGTATTSIVGNLGTSTFSSFISAVAASTTATSTMAGINLPFGGCFAIAGTCVGGSGGSGTVTNIATNNGLTGGAITTTGTLGLDLTKIVNGTLLQYNGSQLAATGTQALTVGNLIATTTTATSSFAGDTTVGSGSTAFVVDYTGFVGIGTSTPFAFLSLYTPTSTIPFNISTSTPTPNQASSTLFQIDPAGDVHYGGGVPALTSCGTGPSLDANSTDQAGTVTVGATGTGCTLTWSTAKKSAPHCQLTQRTMSLVNALSITVENTTTFTFTQTGAGGNQFDYFCPLGH